MSVLISDMHSVQGAGKEGSVQAMQKRKRFIRSRSALVWEVRQKLREATGAELAAEDSLLAFDGEAELAHQLASDEARRGSGWPGLACSGRRIRYGMTLSGPRFGLLRVSGCIWDYRFNNARFYCCVECVVISR